MLAEYSACRRFTIDTVAAITSAGAPPAHNCTRIIWDAPPKTMALIATASHAGMPADVASTP
jgi:hypothetical protein